MNVSFMYAYESIIKLRNKEKNKVGILFSSHFERVKQLVDFFEMHSNYMTKRISLSELAKMISPDGVNMPFGAKDKILRVINRRQKTEYLIIEDKRDLPKSFLLINDLCNVIGEIGEKLPIIVASENPGEFSLVYGTEAEMIDVPSLNDRSLKIKPSSLGTEELYMRNQHQAIRSGIFWANNDFFKNFLEKKMAGDSLFSKGKYQEAFRLYNDVISFHAKFDNDECLINDFLTMTLFVRCIACFLFGNWPERTDATKYMKEDINDIMLKLKKSEMGELHGEMLKDYDLTFLGVKDGWIEKNNYLLFLNEYIF